MRLAPDVSYFGRKPKGLDVCKRSVCEGGLEQGWGEDWGMRSPVEEEIFFFCRGWGQGQEREVEIFENKRMRWGDLKPIRGEAGQRVGLSD